MTTVVALGRADDDQPKGQIGRSLRITRRRSLAIVVVVPFPLRVNNKLIRISRLSSVRANFGNSFCQTNKENSTPEANEWNLRAARHSNKATSSLQPNSNSLVEVSRSVEDKEKCKVLFALAVNVFYCSTTCS